MSDTIQNFNIFKSLGFDQCTQWIFYEDSFKQFFDFFADNIDEANLITEEEVLEINDVSYMENNFSAQELQSQLQQLETKNPGLHQYTQQQEAALMQEILLLENAEDSYTILVEKMRVTKRKLNIDVTEIEDNFNGLLKVEQEHLSTVQRKSKQLEETLRENCRLCNENRKFYTQCQSPPLFMHQLPLDQYFLKCDSFMQYFILYMKENFKIKNIDLNITANESHKFAAKLNNLENSIEHYTNAYIKEKAKAKATQTLVELLDLSNIYAFSLSDMERETRELELLNEHHLKSSYETLVHDIEVRIKQRARQRVELIIYEHTKQKEKRALKLHENDKQLTNIIYDALSNAELVWITMQLDLEKRRNRFDFSEQLMADTSSCVRRIKIMQQRRAIADSDSCFNQLLIKFAELLSQHLGQNVPYDVKVCLYEYEKFGRLLAYALQGILKDKSHILVRNQLNELYRIENILRPLVYDSPVKNPLLDIIHYLQPMFKANEDRRHIEEALRKWRTKYKTNISERMITDKLWRYSQLFWIWFLTEPKRILLSIEEAKKYAAKSSSIQSNKLLVGGIKRN